MIMRSANIQIYVHLVWATWDRQPLICGATKATVYRTIIRECEAFGVELLAIGGVEDHVHLLISLPSTVAVCNFVQKIKNQSSLLAGNAFKWQGAYGAMSVTGRHVPQVTTYIENQAEHHGSETYSRSWEPPAVGEPPRVG